MIIVTGGCGFIGSNLVRGLNRRGIDDVVIVDDLTMGAKFSNVVDCRISDYCDHQSFLDELAKQRFSGIEAIFHSGACSDTMETDGRFMMRINYEYSRRLHDYSVANGIPFIYASSASVYGNGTDFSEDPVNEKALNVYAFSKLLFDRYVRQHSARTGTQVVGLRYFNVYGPCEGHKARMASVAYHFYNQLLEQRHVRLFEGSGGFADGEQRRDFIWVGDVVDVNLFFLDHPDLSGVFNVGTGSARSFNDMARAVVSSVNGQQQSLSDLVKSGVIQYIPFPTQLKSKYQSFTEADTDRLRAVGYTKEFASVEEGVGQYVEWRTAN